MTLPSRIYLTGFMGSGKTTLGRLLSLLLDYQFVDLDTYIEEWSGRAIPDIFAGTGERHFRSLESKALSESFSWSDTVIAVGGGAIVSEETVGRVLQNGLLVYLSAKEDSLLSRIEGSAGTRPLFTDQDSVSALLSARIPFYERAHITYCTDQESPAESISGLVDEIESWCNRIDTS